MEVKQCLAESKKIKAIVVIPAFNEEKWIEKTILETRNYVERIIVVDDGSTDKTASIAKKAGADVISYKPNIGIGHATRIGLKRAMELNSDVIFSMDGDMQHDPRYIPHFLKAIEDGADYVYGKRNFSNYPFDRKIGNLGLTLLTNVLCPTGIMDTESGYRAFTKEAAKKMNLKADKYDVAMDFAYNVWKNKFKIDKIDVIVPIFHSKTTIGRGFKNYCYCFSRALRSSRK